jgi:hypothetical protein
VTTTVQIGTVEILAARVYDAPGGGSALVEPGVYPLVSEDDGRIRWLMRGRRSTRHQPKLEPLGDGMFLGTPGYDDPQGDMIDVPSRAYTRAEFREFVTDSPLVREDDPAQRLRLTIEVEP